MLRIDSRTVELTPKENLAQALFDSLLDRGLSCVEAADRVHKDAPSLSDEFIAYLKG